MSKTAGQPEQAQPMKPFGWFIIAFAILFCWLGVGASYPDVLGKAMGMMGAMLFPFLIAYVLRGRKKKRNWNSFARWFFWLALILPALYLCLSVYEALKTAYGMENWGPK